MNKRNIYEEVIDDTMKIAIIKKDIYDIVKNILLETEYRIDDIELIQIIDQLSVDDMKLLMDYGANEELYDRIFKTIIKKIISQYILKINQKY